MFFVHLVAQTSMIWGWLRRPSNESNWLILWKLFSHGPCYPLWSIQMFLETIVSVQFQEFYCNIVSIVSKDKPLANIYPEAWSSEVGKSSNSTGYVHNQIICKCMPPGLLVISIWYPETDVHIYIELYNHQNLFRIRKNHSEPFDQEPFWTVVNHVYPLLTNS